MSTLAYEQIQAQQILRKFIPTYALSGNTKGAFKHYKKQKAVKLAFLQVNPHNLVCVIGIDIDHDNAAFQWSDVGLPMPNVITLNQDNGKGHYLYYLAVPVAKSDAARLEPLKYLSDIVWNLVELLEGDHCYTNLTTKNPFYEGHRVMWIHDHRFLLNELALACGKVNGTGKLLPVAKNNQGDGLSRNPTLFNQLRHPCYTAVAEYKEAGNYAGWCLFVLQQAEAINRTFSVPLPYNEVKSTAKSVRNYCYGDEFKPIGDGKNRGVMQLGEVGTDLSLAERQALGAEYTNSAQRVATEGKIIDAIGELTAAGKRISMRSVAALAGVSQPNLSKHYRHLFFQGG